MLIEGVNPNDVGIYLQNMAKRQRTVYYNDLVQKYALSALDGIWSSHPLSQIFEVLDQQDADANRPFRSSLVVSKDKHRPGKGFFEALERMKGIADPKTEEARDKLHIHELNAAFAYNWS